MSDNEEIILDNEEIPDYIATADSSESFEEQAKALGWKPEDEYTGKPGNWTDAEKFLAIHGKNNGALKKALEKQATELAELKKQMSGLDAAHRKMFDIQLKKAKDEHEQQLSFLKAQRKEAVRNGEFEAVDELDTQIEVAKTRGPDIPETTQPAASQQDWRENPVMISWVAKNDWFNKDEDMSMFAGNLGPQIRAQNPTITFEELLNKVAERVKKAFPHKFSSGEDRPNKVEGSTPAGQGRNEKGTYASLSKDEKQACDEAVENGMTQKKWLELFNGYENRRAK